MAVQHLCSLDLPPSDRFDWWCDLAGREVMPTLINSGRKANFYASAELLQFGSVSVAELEFDEMGARRTPRLIRDSDPERWELTLVARGSMWVEQGRRRADTSPGDLVLYDTSRPFQSQILDQGSPCRTILLQIPRKALSLPDQMLRAQVARPISSAYGSAALLSRFLEWALEHARTLKPGEYAHLEMVAIDLMATFLAGRIGAEDLIPPQTRQWGLLRQVKTFILGNLHDSNLSPAAIAAAHHISVRYLHHLFHQDGQSVGEFVRRRRLERCHADLSDPRLVNRTVADVGARWGFQDAAAFNRAFKTAYGIPPGEHRRRQKGACDN